MRGWWTWCSAWRTFQKNPVKQNLKGSTSRKAVCRPFPYSYRYQSFLKNTFPKLRWQWTCFLFLTGKYIFIYGPFSSHVSYGSVYPMVFFNLKNSGYIWSINGGCRISDVLGPKIPASSDCDGRDDSHVRTWGRWINGDVWRWASLQLMAPCSAWVLKKDHPLLNWRVFRKGTFRWVMWTCFWLLSFCRDWNFARVQNIITKNNCSKVRRAHSFSANYPGPLKPSISELKQLKIPTVGSDEISFWANLGLFSGALKG